MSRGGPGLQKALITSGPGPQKAQKAQIANGPGPEEEIGNTANLGMSVAW